MKKTILSLMLGRGRGGLESVFVQHAINFKEMGYHSIAVCHSHSPEASRLCASGIEVITMENRIWNPCAWFALIRILRKYRPTIVCMHGNRAIAFGAAKWMRMFVRPFPKLMATTHNSRNKRFTRLDGCFAISHVLEASLTNDFGIPASKVFYCPNAVPFPKEVPNRKFRLPVRIAFLRRFHIEKGGDILLEACRVLKQEGLPFYLEMAGDGGLCEEYKAFVKMHNLEENVTFSGWIGEEEKEAFFERTDILCLPSRKEGLPVTLLEGLAYGIPAVASSCPGMVEVVEGKSCGIIFPIEDVSALVDALRKMINNPALWEQCSIAARKAFEGDYNTEQQKEFLRRGIEGI